MQVYKCNWTDMVEKLHLCELSLTYTYVQLAWSKTASMRGLLWRSTADLKLQE